jgi:hypothetical protein
VPERATQAIHLIHLLGNGIGVDVNPTSVEVCRRRGLDAYTVEEFLASGHARPESFDALLMAHVLEHLPAVDAHEIVGFYLPFVRPGGRVVFIAPQERGFTHDATHVRFVGFAEAAELAETHGLTVDRQFSFPFPRPAGRFFTHNEFVTVAHKG